MLVTGANGMLASDLINHLASQPGYEIVGLARQQMDITRRHEVAEALTRIKPNYVIHTAAQTNVDYCETHINEAFQINGYGTENVAFYAERVGAKLVYISSCGLFGDKVTSYAEYDPVVLKTVYARSKYFGEEKTREWSERYFIVRPGWLFGGGKTHPKNFVYNRYKEALSCPVMYSTSDKFGCPTYTRHLAKKIVSLLQTEYYGTYHITNSGSASRFDYVKKIIDEFGVKTTLLPVDSNRFKRAAPVPDCEILDNMFLSMSGLSLLPDWREAIDEYIQRLKRDM
uniref:SDR family oxidoreductase n=1 Tax=Alicyclobacillus tolerans TaxID=90970 RepID=UPI001F32391C|nr:NAD(P)-dependent oxidoreductase [Alicyclobacillus tolerans]